MKMKDVGRDKELLASRGELLDAWPGPESSVKLWSGTDGEKEIGGGIKYGNHWIEAVSGCTRGTWYT